MTKIPFKRVINKQTNKQIITGIQLTKYIQNLHIKSYKILLKDKKDQFEQIKRPPLLLVIVSQHDQDVSSL